MTRVEVEWTIYGPAGDSIVTSNWGEALDNADKGLGKARSYAQKDLLIRLLEIPTEDPDVGDTETTEYQQEDPDPLIANADLTKWRTMVESFAPKARDAFLADQKQMVADRKLRSWSRMRESDRDTVSALLATHRAMSEQERAAEAPVAYNEGYRVPQNAPDIGTTCTACGVGGGNHLEDCPEKPF